MMITFKKSNICLPLVGHFLLIYLLRYWKNLVFQYCRFCEEKQPSHFRAQKSTRRASDLEIIILLLSILGYDTNTLHDPEKQSLPVSCGIVQSILNVTVLDKTHHQIITKYFNPLKTETHSYNMYNLNSYFTERTLCLHYKDQLINVVYNDNDITLKVIQNPHMHHGLKRINFLC